MKLTKKHKASINDYMRLHEVRYKSLGFTCLLILNALGPELRSIYADFFNFYDGQYNSTVNEKYVFVLPDNEKTQLRSLLLTVFMETYNDCI